MKLSFSTRGWSGLSFSQYMEIACEMGFRGIEVYDIYRDADLISDDGPFHRFNILRTARELFEKRLSVPCFGTRYDISAGGDVVSKLTELMATAHSLGTPYVSCCAFNDNEDTVKKNLELLLPKASENGVTLLIRSSGIYAHTDRLRELLDGFASDNAAALWDMHHTFREGGEEPSATIKNLGAYVKHVHIRDSNDDGSYNLIGEGTLPVDKMMQALSSVDYDGFISLEWRPDWDCDVSDYSIIFPYFINYMSRFDDTRGGKKSLYFNKDGSGQFIWRKDELINLTFSRVLDRVCEEFPDQYAFKYTTLDYQRTYLEFRRDVDHFARALMSMGVRQGSKVSVWATNIPEWFIAFWAVTKIGAVLVSVNTAYKVKEIEYLLRQSDTHTLIMIESSKDSDYAQSINELCPELKGTVPGEPLHAKRLPFLRNVITCGFRMPGCLTFNEVMERHSLVTDKELRRVAALVRPDDVCNMQYTSGTTGFPKGVMLTHYNVINNGKCIGDRMDLSTADRMMIQVPMFHCFGMVLSMTASMTHGTTCCPLPYFSAKASLSCIDQEKITCFNGVPTMFIAMFNHPNYRKTDFSHIRTGIMAGSGCPPELMKRAALPAEMNMGGIVSVYGQTESSPGSTMSAWEDAEDVRCETVGYALPHVMIKITDPVTGETLPPGVQGEFCSKGYNIMKGYYKMPEETASAVDKDGWLHSGDLCVMDEKGCFKVTGRLKDMIIRGGENIYPKEIEEFIYTHPAVKDVQVIGVPDKKYGEEVWAEVILKEGQSLSEAELRSYLAAGIAAHKVPRYIVFTDHFPMNAAGKVMKYKMRENAAELLQNGFIN